MKKFIASALTAAMAVSSAVPFLSAAEDNIPLFYMKVQPNEGYTTEDDGTIVIKRQKNENGFILTPDQLEMGLILTTDIFFYDPNENAWSVSPRWKTSSDYLEISQVYNPFDMDPVPPFAYASVDSSGNITTGGLEKNFSKNTKYGSINFTVRDPKGNSLVKYGETTDSYPLISFDISVDKNIPYGDYEVYFMTYEDNSCSVAVNDDNATIYRYPNLRLENMKIRIEGANPGDVNNDGAIDAADSSLVLTEYASVSTGGNSILDETQKEAADVAYDNIIDSSDASFILEYYAYASTTQGDVMTLREFYKSKHSEPLS